MLATFEINRLYASFFLKCLKVCAFTFIDTERGLGPALRAFIKRLLALVHTV